MRETKRDDAGKMAIRSLTHEFFVSRHSALGSSPKRALIAPAAELRYRILIPKKAKG